MKGKGQTVEESIRIEAYLLSEKAGHPSGMHHYFWEQAQAIVHTRTMAVAGAVKKAAVKAKAKPAAKPVAAKQTKPKAAKATKDAQLSLDGKVTAPSRKRPPKK